MKPDQQESMQCSFYRIVENEIWPSDLYNCLPLLSSAKKVFGQNVHFTLCSYFFLASKDMSRSNYLTGLSRAQLSLKGDGTISSSFLHLCFRCYFVLLFVNLFNYLTTSRQTYRFISRTENKRNRQSEGWVKISYWILDRVDRSHWFIATES